MAGKPANAVGKAIDKAGEPLCDYLSLEQIEALACDITLASIARFRVLRHRSYSHSLNGENIHGEIK